MPDVLSRLPVGSAVGLSALYAATCGLLSVILPSGPHLWVALALSPPLILLSLADLVTRRLPDVLTVSVAAIALVWLTAAPVAVLAVHLATAGAMIAGLWFASEIAYRRLGREALGLGDVKLIGAGALLLGPIGVWLMLFLASVSGLVVALRDRDAIPFAPFLGYAIILSHAILAIQEMYGFE